MSSKMDGELLSLKWNNHRTTFLHVIGSLRSKATYTDATLACEGKFYPVHRLVLSTCSEYFGAIFEKTPCKSPVVVLKDIECKNLEFLLDYMYIGEVNVRQNELASLIRSAECLRIKGLAVPDEDPSLLSCNSTKERLRSDSHRESSPPAKRRRSRHFSSDEKRYKPNYRKDNSSLEESLHNISKSSETKEIINNDSVIKLEPSDVGVDSESEGNFVDHTVDNDDLRSDEGGGAEENDRENASNDLVEFFKETVEKEEPISLSDYSSDFAGPSGAQNSNNAQWDNENSFPSEALSLDSSNNSATQADSQHQQQMLRRWVDHLSRLGGWNKLKCPICLKVCSRSDKLKLHLRIHTGEKPYCCTYCPHRSRTSDDLKRHIRTHTGERPYQCPFCPYRASDPSTIRSHKKHKHGYVPLPRAGASKASLSYAETTSSVPPSTTSHPSPDNLGGMFSISLLSEEDRDQRN